jgi:hypothetical protein
MVRTGPAFAVILYDVVRRFVNTMQRRIFGPKEGERVSVMDPAMESYGKCIPYPRDNYRKCLYFGKSYG